MMTQTLAIFHDAYRELNSKKLFWITLILSGLFMAGFGLLGVKGDKLTLLTFEFPMPMASFVYKQIFNWVVLWLWLTIAAVILALISTGGIFPDFISGGSVDMYLSKPISRLRLFITKYLAGMLFVILQVALFSLASFIVLGLRAGEWKPGLFMAIPLVVAFFSYLFSLCVLFGVLTRSTIAALLLTILVWPFLFALHKAEETVFAATVMFDEQVSRNQKQKVAAEAELARLTANPSTSAKLQESRINYEQRKLDRANARLSDVVPGARKLKLAHQILYGVKTVLPKTSETTNMLERWLFTDAEIEARFEQQENDAAPMFQGEEREDIVGAHDAAQRAQMAARDRSPAWVIGTSLAFEAVVLTLAAWVFCRRDY